MTTPITFYILQSSTVSVEDAVLNFVCKLTQTVLKRSQNSLVIVDDDHKRLRRLDTLLWSFEPTAFIPHEIFLAEQINDKSQITTFTEETTVTQSELTDDAITSFDTDSVVRKKAINNNFDNSLSSSFYSHEQSNREHKAITLADLTAPVTLVSMLPEGFDGVVINIAREPIKLGTAERVLEIIAPDSSSIERGREKVHYYRGFKSEVTYHSIKSPL